MRYGPLGFIIVTHKDEALSHHLEVGPFPDNFGFTSIPGKFLRYHEALGHPRKVVDIFEIDIVNFSCIFFQAHYDVAYTIGFGDPPDAAKLCISPRV